MNYIPNQTRYSDMTYNQSGARGLKLPAVSLGLWHSFGDTSDFENMYFTTEQSVQPPQQALPQLARTQPTSLPILHTTSSLEYTAANPLSPE